MRPFPAAAMVLFFAVIAGCQDFNQRARGLGREARLEAERACPHDDGTAPIDTAFAIDACLAHACEAPCVKAGAESFQRVCVDVCSARGGCDRDEDCTAGLRCVAIAPVLRRCTAVAGDAGR
jgi:hypothetical protein